ncbi:TRAP-type mannitol/chloroaromatic compound transport system, small permease component [Allopseudospirillum japonicum]|uniref:TRAP transporter small permease protein n=1 Tax=Allopseudospirillum japonicum TaxID=64971 RepID=A0A1H6RVS4_9GAMM|nr:TRAP transporter small permease subunit [Allopseudospirillum japonicum]SEI55645.1 TRAP-type mannitol/chloroaromatic compound transport system, small permease component [Allopseudospirillum japonicum]
MGSPSEPSHQHSMPFADALDAGIQAIGRVFAWSYVLLVAVIILQVVLRYGFNQGLVMLEELQWHLYALGVMFGVSYAQTTNSHIRVDLFHMRMSRRRQAWVEVLGILFLLLPFVYVVLSNSFGFVYDAWRINESSAAPTGLPWRWLIKSVIPLSFALLGLAACARLLRELHFLFHRPAH